MTRQDQSGPSASGRPARPSRLRNAGINLGVILATGALIGLSLEYVAVPIVDDGMQYDLEMWKYARHVKRVSENPELGHAHRPGAREMLMGREVTTNSLGLRDREIDPEKKPAATRILMLGDSITFGWGVRQDLTVPQRLQSALGGSGVEVINSGVGNYNTRMEVEYFLTEGYKLKPDIVVLNYFVNDAEPVPSYDNSLLEKYSKAFVYFSSRWDAAMRGAGLGGGQQTDWKSYYRGLYEDRTNPGGWSGAEKAIERAAAYCREHGMQFAIVHYPELRELRPYPFAEVTARLRTLSERLGVPFIDLLPSVEKEPPASLWVTVPDPHPNERATELFAAALVEPLRAMAAGVAAKRAAKAN
ncbi:MAG: SGNH/GDSL hydrolase family protein [Rhodospirillales bacterium]|nr:SGNH/GDSL hydrolase family protein [Rhodospirillales bacterium]